MRFTASTVFESSEQWTSPLPQSAVLKTLAAAFEAEGATSMGALGAGSVISARAYDTFGFRVTDKMYFGADETFKRKLEEMLGKAAAALGVERSA